MGEHTPWTIGSRDRPTVWGIGDVTHVDEWYVVDCRGIFMFSCGTGEKGKERARLMAAAPDMYDFIEGIAMGRCCQTEGCCTDDPSCDTMEARAIIAKAKGES